MDIYKGLIDNVSYSYIGSEFQSDRKSVIFFFGSNLKEREMRNVVLSCYDAHLNGYDIISNNLSKSSKAISYSSLSLKGRLSYVYYMGLEKIRIENPERIALSLNGSLISFLEDDEIYYKENMMECNAKLLTLSDKIIFIKRVPKFLAEIALERGMDVAVLKDFLYEKSIFNLAKEGAPVIDTFSSWLEIPRSISYFDEKSHIKSLKF